MAGLDNRASILEVADFSGGLNIKAANQFVQDNQAITRLNCHSDTTGAIIKRGGRDYLNPAEIVAGKGIFGLYKFYKTATATSYFLAACNTSLYEWNGTTGFDSIKDTLTINKYFDFATYDISDIVVICNGADAPMKYAGAGAGTVSALGGTPPATMAAVIVHKQRAFCYTPNSSYLYCSEIGNMESWDTTNWKWKVGSTTGDFLTGFGVLSGVLFLFKQNSIRYFITEGSKTEWQMGDPLTTKGAISRFTICNAEMRGKPALLYTSLDGVYAFDGLNAVCFSDEDIDPIFSSSTYTYRLNKTYANLCVAVVHNNKYYLSYPSGTSEVPDRTIVLDLVKGGWSEYDFGVRCFCEWTGKGDSKQLYSGLPATGHVVQEDTGNDDFDSDIVVTYKTKYFQPNKVNNFVNSFWQIYCKVEATAATTLITTLSRDFGADSVGIPKGLSAATYPETFYEPVFPLLTGENVAIEFYNRSQVGLKIHNIGVYNTMEYLKEGGVMDTGWTAYTPVVTSAGGAITAYTATGRRRYVDDIVYVQIKVVVTTKGTATGAMIITLPATKSSDAFANTFPFYESVNTTKSANGVIIASGTQIKVLLDDGTTPFLTNGDTWWGSGWYEK